MLLRRRHNKPINKNDKENLIKLKKEHKVSTKKSKNNNSKNGDLNG